MTEKEEILKFIQENKTVTFKEIEEEFNASGETHLKEPKKNIVIYDGISEEMADILNQLTSERKIGIQLYRSIPQEIEDQGKVFDLPLAENPPEKGYESPHWAPSLIKYIEDKEKPEPPL